MIFRISNNSYLSANSSRPCTSCENTQLQRFHTNHLEGLTEARESRKETRKSPLAALQFNWIIVLLRRSHLSPSLPLWGPEHLEMPEDPLPDASQESSAARSVGGGPCGQGGSISFVASRVVGGKWTEVRGLRGWWGPCRVTLTGRGYFCE